MQTTDNNTSEAPLVTAGMLEQWRIRKAELDVVLGAAGAEAADLARKIKAAEFLLKCQEHSHD